MLIFQCRAPPASHWKLKWALYGQSSGEQIANGLSWIVHPISLTSCECSVTVNYMWTLIVSPVIETNYIWPVFIIMTRAISYLPTTLRLAVLPEHIELLYSMLPSGFGLIDKPCTGCMSWVLYCSILVFVALCPLVVYHTLNHLNQAWLHPVGGEVLCA